MIIEIQASNLTLSEQEIRSHLPLESFQKLQGKKIHPWIVGETGISQPRDLVSGSQKQLRWPRMAIQALRKALKAGTKLFVGHGKGTNSHDGRTEVGYVADTFERELPDGTLQVVALGLLDSDRPELDVCSIEADVDITEYGDVYDVANISAVALGNSRVDSPAFPGAQRLASMQFFGDNKENDSRESKGVTRMTYAEIKAGVEELGLAPHRLFTADQVREDNRLMRDLSEPFVAQISELEKATAELTAEKEHLASEAEAGREAASKLALTEAKTKLKAALPEGMTDKQKTFLLNEFRAESEEDLTEESIKAYVEQGTQKFAEYARMFGDESNPSGGGTDAGGSGGDTEPADELLKAITG
jgi:hypothetical protein